MKKLFKIILGATVGSTLLLSSCNFLDVDPYLNIRQMNFGDYNFP